MATTNRVLKARVERGVALLDEKLGPEWCERIVLPDLFMHSGNQCVLGQLYPSTSLVSGYVVGRDALGIGVRGEDVPYGFSMDAGHFTDRRLTPLWREAIEARCGGSER